MLNPQFVAGEHGLFGGHKSEDIRTFSSKTLEYHPSHHEKPPIISNMLCVKKTTLKFGIRIVLDTRYVN